MVGSTKAMNRDDVSITRVEFRHGGRTFVAVRFTRCGASRGVEIYAVGHDGIDEFLRYAHEGTTSLCARAAREIAVAEADPHPGADERFAAIELD